MITRAFYLFFKLIFSGYKTLSDKMEKYLPLLSILGLITGVFMGWAIPKAARLISSGIEGGIDFYGYIAPVVIFIILAPSLSRMINAGKGRFASYAIIRLSLSRLVSSVWAVIFTAVIFGFPLISGKSANFTQAISHTLRSLGWMAINSTYFYAIYASIIVVILGMFIRRIEKMLRFFGNSIEMVGQSFIPIIPIFMLAIGAFIYSLPAQLNESFEGGITLSSLNNMTVFGLEIPTQTPFGMVLTYVVASLVVGLACIIWHIGLLLLTKKVVPDFSIKTYFRDYWVRVYPLLWATSSEAISTPLNLYLVKKHYPYIRKEVRRFVVGIGSYVAINGTMICVFVLAGAVANILGLQISAVDLLMCVPVVFLIGFGVPGIPGELILFAGPVVMILNIPAAIVPTFLLLYIGLQIGLPDSFRTGNNSTDDCLFGNLMNHAYERKFAHGREALEYGYSQSNTD